MVGWERVARRTSQVGVVARRAAILSFPAAFSPTDTPHPAVEHATRLCASYFYTTDTSPACRALPSGTYWDDIYRAMPRNLHPHLQLKRGRDTEDYDIDPDDLIEPLPDRHHDPQSQAAKRRRVEAIALQCYRGRPPFILSAGLRGPFDKSWKNPWAEEGQNVERRQSSNAGTLSNKTRGAVERKIRSRDKQAGASKAVTQNLAVPAARGAKRMSKASQTTSPEASRAAADDLEYHEQTHSFDDLEVPPATAPTPEDDVTPNAQNYFSASTTAYIQSRSPLTNPFWLRRPASQSRVDANQPTSSTTDASPTHLRSGGVQLSLGQERYLALPKAPLYHQRPSADEVVPEHWRSSASASMIISSPVTQITSHTDRASTLNITPSVQPAQDVGLVSSTHDDISSSARHRADSAQDEDNTLSRHSQGTQHAQAVASCQTPATMQSNPSTLSQQMHDTDSVQMLVPATVYRTSTSVQSVERLVETASSSCASAKREQQRVSRRSSQNRPSHVSVKDSPVASSALASSTGFMYRKIGDPKAKSNNASRPKPRAINFSSSPVSTKDTRASTKRSPQKMGSIQETGIIEQNASVAINDPEVEEVGNIDNNGSEEGQEQQFSHSSRASVYSTQAAMLLAQLEFQEGTFPTMSSESPQPWTQPQDDTPRPKLLEPSFAITPLSDFKAPLDKSRPPESVFRGPPISTQDLFSAASPFAFSTAKKKSERPQQSSLRFALLSQHGEESREGGSPAKSPTPAADRIPLKEKNTTMLFWSCATKKASQVSHESSAKDSRRSISDVKLPRLDFHTSLDDYGHDGEVHFTDRLLRNMNDT
ncbi:hypothetical protein P153DRAFT_355407 [Dothidotthia symphoricarpi CBS 119687]|uniref:Protamine P1 n=1 Tax=Dothidotthia symphoricarpi CBS 119687 TaxID=1392245 RepID=A0A6A6AIA0_9PLEO|nr:uncharacterized protein P153DRAFT_355407 [Dothidotthia symphoricarpi CBS 119687]KAF2131669.1 hypothetical protein P153DRAFT_355407 [Dothidotthia symphoricarpi CBS 119687]